MASASTSTSTTSKPDTKDISVLFVCLGNICRSPMAEGVFSHLLKTHKPSSGAYRISHINSAGTAAYHIGSSPDPRTMRVLQQNKITDYKHKAQKVSVEDFVTYTHIFGMDEENYEDLVDMKRAIERARSSGNSKGKGSGDGKQRTRSHAYDVADEGTPLASVHLYGEFGGTRAREEVIDPYYGGNDGFTIAFEQMERFGRGFLKYLDEGGSEGEGKQGKM